MHKIKKKILLPMTLMVMIFSLFLALMAETACAEEFLSDTYFWGFEDNKLPSAFSTTYIDGTFSDGIWKITPTDRIINGVSSPNPRIKINQSFNSEAVNCLKIRVKHDLAGSAPDKIQVYYSVLDNGVASALSESNKFSISIASLSTNGEYVTYTVPFTGKATYTGTIAYLRVDLLNRFGTTENPTIDVDYIMLTKEDSAIEVWNFDDTSDLKAWVPNTSDKNNTWNVSDGMLNCTVAAEGTNPKLITLTYTPSAAIETTDYDYVEVLMKHNTSEGESTASDRHAMKMYIQGELYSNGSEPVEVSFNEQNKKNCTLVDTSHDNIYRYVFPLSGQMIGGKSIDDAKITKLRIDPIRNQGTCAIESIRLIPKNHADMTDVDGHEEGTDNDHLNMGFVVETDDISEYKSLKVKINNGSKRLVGGYDLSNTFGSMSGPVKLGLQINDVPKDYENYITVQLSPDAVKSVNANETDLAN